MVTQAIVDNSTRRQPKYGPFALVTGASSGIGRAFAFELPEQGYELVLTARDQKALEELAVLLRMRYKIEVVVVNADMSTPADIVRLLSICEAKDIGLLVAAAGYGSSGKFTNGDLESELNMIDVNCRAVANLTYTFGKRFASRQRGGIVLLSSLVAFQGVALSANYAATKAYIQSFAEGLHIELKSNGVDVIACAPGPIASGFAARANMVMNISQTPDVVAKATLNAIGKKLTIRPGYLAKLLEASFTGLPRNARVRIMSLVMKSMANKSSEA